MHVPIGRSYLRVPAMLAGTGVRAPRDHGIPAPPYPGAGWPSPPTHGPRYPPHPLPMVPSDGGGRGGRPAPPTYISPTHKMRRKILGAKMVWWLFDHHHLFWGKIEGKSAASIEQVLSFLKVMIVVKNKLVH